MDSKIKDMLSSLDRDNELQDKFYEFIREGMHTQAKSDTTTKNYIYSIRNLFRFRPRLELDDIDRTLVVDFFEWLDNRERQVGNKMKSGIKKSTKKTYHIRLDTFFSWLKNNGYIAKNPFDNMKKPRVGEKCRKFLNRQEIDEVLNFMKFEKDWSNDLVKTRNIALINLALHSGLRKNELLSLKVSDVGFERKEMSVKKPNSKSKSGRIVPLTYGARRDLEVYMRQRQQQETNSPFLWISNNTNERFTKHGLKHLVNKIKDKVDFNFHLHRCRYTFAANGLEVEGVDFWDLKRLMGHETIDATTNYLTSKHKFKEQDRLDGFNLGELI